MRLATIDKPRRSGRRMVERMARKYPEYGGFEEQALAELDKRSRQGVVFEATRLERLATFEILRKLVLKRVPVVAVLLFTLATSTHTACAELSQARLTYSGIMHYQQDFSIGGRAFLSNFHSERTTKHPTPEPVSLYTKLNLFLAWKGLNWSNTFSRPSSREVEYLPKLEYNLKTKWWDLSMYFRARIHLNNIYDNFIEYGLANGFRFDNQRLAIQITRVADTTPQWAYEILHEIQFTRVVHLQSALGYETNLTEFLKERDRSDSNRGARRGIYLDTLLALDFYVDETYKPVFEIGLHIHEESSKIITDYLIAFQLSF